MIPKSIKAALQKLKIKTIISKINRFVFLNIGDLTTTLKFNKI